ncbi:cupin domain-containing protein [Microbacterium azadirachtae]|uniref:Cupin domain protein n=1 Tax=Microbacterium azadirachtae TaxID=582680 RepID=A0A0F0LQD7_9MICO|nr:cupin domain-containing protein [Microbacterium azadirachtae]KJL33731.1 Cupin domain protein [Microbacterium azadirachtae]
MTDLFPGAVGVSRLRVYTDRAIDGLRGGSPHLHTVCSEGYLVTSGNGRVQTLTLGEGFRETALAPGALLWFGPGTIHRLVNEGDLELVVIMQNSGLPEAGDAVLTFPDAQVSAATAYSAAARIDGPDAASRLTAAMIRRDRAVEGFSALRDAAASGDLDPLRRFHARAAALVADHADTWRERWRTGAWTAAAATSRQLDAIEAADTAHFADAAMHRAEPVERLGMCGWLRAY